MERPRLRLSSIWIIPLIAALLGGWLVVQHYSSSGPEVDVRFETAEGITAEKTKVRCRNVTIGTVSDVSLTNDLQGVVVHLKLEVEAKNLLREDTRFWVVRARVGGGGISGLGTLVSGAYIELDPGIAPRTRKDSFIGLETPPVTPSSVPGLRLKLTADEAASLAPGSSIYFRGVTVGKLEGRRFDADLGTVEFDAFIEESYARLATENVRFWNASGLDLELGADGVRIETGSLESMIIGGVEFDLPEGSERGPPATSGDRFRLFESRRSAGDQPTYNARLTYLLLSRESVRGLSKDAPVDFRGVRIGTVRDISFHHFPNDAEHRVPILISIDPSLIVALPDDTESSARSAIAQAVDAGLRASLKTGSLLTGQLMVSLDYVANPKPAAIAQAGSYEALPLASSGLSRIEDQLVNTLEKINSLDLEATLTAATLALQEIKTTAAASQSAITEIQTAAKNLDTLLADTKMRSLPANLTDSLAAIQSTLKSYNAQSAIYTDVSGVLTDLRATLKSIEALADGIDRKPNSLIFGRSRSNPEPPKGSR